MQWNTHALQLGQISNVFDNSNQKGDMTEVQNRRIKAKEATKLEIEY